MNTNSSPQPVFVVGCPRSGTTWLQLLLAQHPEVVTCQETHLFNRYLGPLERFWQGEKDHPADEREVGLRNALTDDKFYDLCRSFAHSVLQSIAADEHGADIVVEKSPHHVRYGPLIHRLLPNAIFLHIIRDPRSVVASLQRAGESWGSDWAPTRAHGCARMWVSDVTQGRKISNITDRYTEVHYEGLLNEGPRELQDLLAFIGLREDLEWCKRAVAVCSIDNLREGGRDMDSPWDLDEEPDNFYRKGRAESWKEDLGSREVRHVEYIAYELMQELGYRPSVSNPTRQPPELWIRDRLAPAVNGIRSAARRLAT